MIDMTFAKKEVSEAASTAQWAQKILERLQKGESPEKVSADFSDPFLACHFNDWQHELVSWCELKEGRILEIGSGYGGLTGAFCKELNKVTCIELCEAKSRCNEARHQSYPLLKIYVGDFFDIELSEEYDLITVIGSFESIMQSGHQADPLFTFLKKLHQCLKRGGRILLAMENPTSPYSTSHYLKRSSITSVEMEELFKSFGLEVLDILYPYPDLKVPQRLFSRSYRPTMNDVRGEADHAFYEGARPDNASLFLEGRQYQSFFTSSLFVLTKS